MSAGWIVLIVILAVLVAVTVILYFLGKRMEKKRAEQREQIEAASQQITMLIIDKKKMKIKEAGLPQQAVEKTPWYASRAKVPIVRAKVGPKIMNFIADEAVYNEIPLKKEVKATIAGLYITAFRGAHGKLNIAPHKKTFREKLAQKLNRYETGK